MLLAGMDELRPVVDLVTTEPGLSRAAVARRIGGRRGDTLALVDRAVALDLVNVGRSGVPTRGGARRSVPGLFPGSAVELALLAPPTLTAGQVRARRTAAGVSVAALAGCLGVRKCLVQSWEAGRQAVPAWVTERLPVALEAARGVKAPRRRRDSRCRREVLQAVRERPGITRHALVGTSPRAAKQLDEALRTGLLHERVHWPRNAGRQEVVGVFLGREPQDECPCECGATDRTPAVSVAELCTARLAAGWNQAALAGRLGIAPTTLSRYELSRETFPTWLSARAARALTEARADVHDFDADDRARILEELRRVAPAGLTVKELRRRLGWSPRILAAIGSLLAAGEAHQRHAGISGEQSRLYLGPTPAEVLSPAQLRELRTSRGLRQDQVGALLPGRAGKTTVCQWERGSKRMALDVQHALRTGLEALPVPVPVPDELAPAELRTLRTRARLTQPELAALSGVHVATISQIERQGLRVSLPTQRKLRDVLDREVQALDAGHVERERRGPFSDAELDAQALDALTTAGTDGLSRGELHEAMRGDSRRRWARVEALCEAGQVVRHGRRGSRATRFYLPTFAPSSG